jgi:aspartyl-tRNA(Asn)/glutamyl-tRNA(Gln) amidotransferase subunit C
MHMEIKDIDKLAELARLEISQEEKASLVADFGSIMNYIAQISEVEVPSDLVIEFERTNVMREDIVTTDSGQYTDRIINEMPDHQDGFLKVKQIL